MGTSDQSFVVQIDTPSVKQYVFGTDPLNEVRGASACLDRLNRQEMDRVLRAHLGAAAVEKIYANGGSAQFLVRTPDKTSVETACRALVRHLGAETKGAVRAVYGIAPLRDGDSYRDALGVAHFRMRCRREFESGHRAPSTMPIIMECSSASHLPAAHIERSPEVTMLSDASRRKVREGRAARTGDVWSRWMRHLGETGPWTAREHWKNLRCENITDLGERSSWRDYVGVVYADGNAMGKVVQELDRPETCRHFSTIVDNSLREACFSGLQEVMGTEIEEIREAANLGPESAPESPRVLPADILLLGGDDLLVAVPADRALNFARRVISEFERLTRERIAALQDEAARRFFRHRLEGRGFTISCGVAIARGTYPFYLSLDLAEQLLRNAKRGAKQGASDGTADDARIDFHVVTGASSQSLEHVRKDTYRTETAAPRTLRPLTSTQLEMLRDAVAELRRVGFPRSKLHELRDAALAPNEDQAAFRVRDVFARCRHGSERSHRHTLWNAVKCLRPNGLRFDFPWYCNGNHRLLGVADLVDGYDLFPH